MKTEKYGPLFVYVTNGSGSKTSGLKDRNVLFMALFPVSTNGKSISPSTILAERDRIKQTIEPSEGYACLAAWFH